MTYFDWEILAALFLAALTIILVIRKSSLFWPLLIIANIVGNGPKLFGYNLWDELLSASVVAGGLLRILIHYKNPEARTNILGHKVLFNVWIGYMIMQSFRGIIANEDPRIMRWVLYYGTAGVLSALLYYRRKEFPFPGIRQTSILIMATVTIYYVGYIAHGVFMDMFFGIGERGRIAAQFLTSGFLWAGSATAVVPTLIAVPSALFLLDDSSRRVRLLAWGTLTMTMVVAFFYDSRMSWICIFAFILVYAYKIGTGKIVVFAATFLLVFTLYVPEGFKALGDWLLYVGQSSQALWNPVEGDVTRKLQFHAGLLRLIDNPLTFFFGDGVYSHRFTIIPYIEELNAKYLPEQQFWDLPGYKETRDDTSGSLTIFRTTGFSGLLVDGGVIGMLLFVLNFIMVGHKLIRNKSGHRVALLLMVFLSFMWLFNNNVTEVFLFLLLIAPNGFIENLNAQSKLMHHA
jgi:hypothetical protein